jgi:hypothetical protein
MLSSLQNHNSLPPIYLVVLTTKDLKGLYLKKLMIEFSTLRKRQENSMQSKRRKKAK